MEEPNHTSESTQSPALNKLPMVIKYKSYAERSLKGVPPVVVIEWAKLKF